jgi:hypothetical protein
LAVVVAVVVAYVVAVIRALLRFRELVVTAGPAAVDPAVEALANHTLRQML